MIESRVRELLDELTPSYEDRVGDWDSVVAVAGAGPVTRSRRLVRAAAVLAAVVGVAAVALAWPFGAEQGGLLERARAAIGEGPVLHVVLRGEWGGTVVDLASGTRRPVHGEEETWYDSESGRVHSVSRLGGVVQHEQLYVAEEPPAELVALGEEYRQALQTGTAQVGADATVDDEPVVWITIRRELLPDVADGKDHEWAQQVAVSRRTFEPVALRETRDGRVGPGTLQRVLELKLLPAGEGDFTAPKQANADGTVYSAGREPIEVEQARETLGREPLWLGPSYGGAPLAQAFRNTNRTGRRREVKLTGTDAQAARKCRELHGREAGACFRALARAVGTTSLSGRPDGVFKSEGPIVWSAPQTSLTLFYGTVGDDPSTYRKDTVPLYNLPHLAVTEATEPTMLSAGPYTDVGVRGSYVPPEGSVFITAGGQSGTLQRDGIQIAIQASTEEATLEAARALEPMP